MEELEKVDKSLRYASLVYRLSSVENENKFPFPNFLKFIKYKENGLEYCRTSKRWTITTLRNLTFSRFISVFEKEGIKHDKRK